MNNLIRLTFLGTGTSQGVPMIGCGCDVCTSSDKRDRRLRSSALVEYFIGRQDSPAYGGTGMREKADMTVLVDAGPDFRYQMLRAGVGHLDAILLTHNHKDHTGGLDDIRAFNYLERRPTEIYCEKYVEDSLRLEYSYAFAEKKYPGAPEWQVHNISPEPFSIRTFRIVPVRGMHFTLPVLGYRFGNIAYCTDMNRIPDEEFSKLQGLDHFVINCVRRGRHISHFSLEQALETAERVGARHTWLTHLSHQLPRYTELAEELPEGVLPAYDGLTIESTI